MRRWKTLLLITGVVTVALTIVAVAYARTGDASAVRDGRGPVCGALVGDSEALEAMGELRAEHRRDMRAWWQEYGGDPTSSAATEALRTLRQEHQREMRELLEKAGIEVPDDVGAQAGPRGACGGWGAACGAGPGAGGCGTTGAAGAQEGGCGGMMGGWSY